MRALALFVSFLILAGCDDDGGGSGPTSDGKVQVEDAAAEGDAAPTPMSDAAPPDAAVDMGAPPCAAPVEAFTPVSVGAWTVEHAPSGRWRVLPPHGGAAVLESGFACPDDEPLLRVGRGEPHFQSGFGAFRIELASERAPMAWTGPVGAPTATEDMGLTLDWGEVALRFERHPAGLMVALRLPEDADAGELSWRCGEDESFFGLGSQVTGLDLRGRSYPLWTQEQGIGKPDTGFGFPLANSREAAYAPMGVWHSTGGASAIVGHDRFSELDLCATHPDRVALRSLGADPSFVLMPGATPRERLESVTAVVGRPPAPPAWLFAPWNDAVGGPERLRSVAEKLRAENIPSSAIWTEDWIGGEQTPNGYRLSYAWAWSPEAYPDLPADIEWLHARGFAFLGYFNPFVPDTTRMWTEGSESGWLVEDANDQVMTFLDPAFRTASLVDLTDPGAREWLGGYLLTALRDVGLDGWMADFAEWLPVDAVKEDGRSGWAAHNDYPLMWQKANRTAIEQARAEDGRTRLFFARSGWASINGGSAGIAPVMWAGDQNTNWERDDGFPTVIPIGLHLGLAGVAFYGSDIAGYTSETAPNTNKELFYRWSSLGAFHAVMRTHHGSDECGNWNFDRDPETVEHYRRYTTIHTLLYPYFRRLGDAAVATGLPVMRHPWLVEPERPALWRVASDQFFVGDDLLVAPVVEEGATSRTVHLPDAGWWPLFGAAPAPAAVIVAEAPATELPVFVRPGTALPLLAEPVASFYGASVEGVTDLGDVEGRFRLALYPDAQGGLRDLSIAGGTVRGAGWTDVDWSQASVGDAPLPDCAEAMGDCRSADGVQVTGPATLTVGAATLELPAGQWRVALGGAAWGEWAQPTPLTDLDPDVTPPCEVEEE